MDPKHIVKEPQAYRHSWDQQHFFYYHRVCVEHNPPDVSFDSVALDTVPQEAQCDFCYRAVHGASAYYADQEVQV
jgi:hypothetical protein